MGSFPGPRPAAPRRNTDYRESARGPLVGLPVWLSRLDFVSEHCHPTAWLPCLHRLATAIESANGPD
eukprot:11919991-Alexandrium_andersonii.AAC.1